MTDNSPISDQISSAPPCRVRRILAVAWPATLLLAALALLAAPMRLPVRRVAEAVAFPYQLDAEEGFMLNQAMRLADGAGLYTSLAEPPYLVDNYPPLYPALWSLFVHSTGASLTPGRTICAAASVLAALAVAMLTFWKMAGGESGKRLRVDDLALGILVAVLMPMLFLTSRAWMRWNPYARVDIPATALALWGFALFALTARRPRAPFARSVAVALFGLAFLTKQTALVAPAACAVWLLWKNRAAAVRFMAALAGTFALPFALLLAATRGRYWMHLVTYNRNVMHWNELAGWLGLVWVLYAPLLAACVLVAAGLAGAAILRRRSSPAPAIEEPSACAVPLSLAGVYLAINAISLIALAKAGAAENYLLEPLAALALFAGTGTAALLRVRERGPLVSRRTASAAAGLALGAIVLHAARFGQAGPSAAGIASALYFSAPRPNVRALVAGDRVVRRIEQANGPVLSEDPIYPLRAGRSVPFQHFIMTQLTGEGKWNEKPMVESVERGTFALIVAHQDIFVEKQYFNRYSPAMREAIRSRYRFLERIDRLPPLQPIYLYVPREEARP